MDCPSEENIIRMKLDGAPGIQSLNFDIPNRKLLVQVGGGGGFTADDLVAVCSDCYVETKRKIA